jgi:multidrug efflux pump subunit AcrA (membrane-fusion protein)
MPVRVVVIRPVIPRVVPAPSPGIIGVWIIPSVPIAPAVSPWIVPSPSPVPPVVPINGTVVAVAVAIVMVVPVPSERVVPSQIPRIDYNVYSVGRTVKFS